jgi:hypothetical protein
MLRNHQNSAVLIPVPPPAVLIAGQNNLAGTPVAKMNNWVRSLNNMAFGNPVPATFETSTAGRPGYTLCCAKFDYRAGTTVVYLAYQSSNPSIAYAMYFDPDLKMYTQWDAMPGELS